MEELARVILLLAVLAVVLAYARGGWDGEGGVRDWFRSKLVGAPRTAYGA